MFQIVGFRLSLQYYGNVGHIEGNIQSHLTFNQVLQNLTEGLWCGLNLKNWK